VKSYFAPTYRFPYQLVYMNNFSQKQDTQENLRTVPISNFYLGSQPPPTNRPWTCD